MNDVYLLGEAFKRDAIRVAPRDNGEFLNDIAVTRAETMPGAAIKFKVSEGTKQFDLVGTTLAIPLIVSDHLIEVLRKNDFTGWSTYPIEIVCDDDIRIEGFCGLAISGRCGPIDDSLSQEVLIEPPVPEGNVCRGLRGICFEPNTWDGSDFFMAPNYHGKFVTHEVKNALTREAIQNALLEQASSIERLWPANTVTVG